MVTDDKNDELLFTKVVETDTKKDEVDQAPAVEVAAGGEVAKETRSDDIVVVEAAAAVTTNVATTPSNDEGSTGHMEQVHTSESDDSSLVEVSASHNTTSSEMSSGVMVQQQSSAEPEQPTNARANKKPNKKAQDDSVTASTKKKQPATNVIHSAHSYTANFRKPAPQKPSPPHPAKRRKDKDRHKDAGSRVAIPGNKGPGKNKVNSYASRAKGPISPNQARKQRGHHQPAKLAHQVTPPHATQPPMSQPRNVESGQNKPRKPPRPHHTAVSNSQSPEMKHAFDELMAESKTLGHEAKSSPGRPRNFSDPAPVVMPEKAKNHSHPRKRSSAKKQEQQQQPSHQVTTFNISAVPASPDTVNTSQSTTSSSVSTLVLSHNAPSSANQASSSPANKQSAPGMGQYSYQQQRPPMAIKQRPKSTSFSGPRVNTKAPKSVSPNKRHSQPPQPQHAGAREKAKKRGFVLEQRKQHDDVDIAPPPKANEPDDNEALLNNEAELVIPLNVEASMVANLSVSSTAKPTNPSQESHDSPSSVNTNSTNATKAKDRKSVV